MLFWQFANTGFLLEEIDFQSVLMLSSLFLVYFYLNIDL